MNVVLAFAYAFFILTFIGMVSILMFVGREKKARKPVEAETPRREKRREKETTKSKSYEGGFSANAGTAFGTMLAFLVVLIVIVLWNYESNWGWWQSSGNRVFAATPRENIVPSPSKLSGFLPLSKEGCERAEKFWKENLTGPGQATEMIEITKKESGCNQFEADGITPYRGHVNPLDTGIMQVNKYWWLNQSVALGPDYSLYTEEGNLKMALWIRKNYGANEWNTATVARETARRNEFTINVPVGKLSEKIEVRANMDCHGKPSGKVKVYDDDGHPYDLEPGNSDVRFATTTVRYESATGEPETVRWYCR